MNGLVGGLTPQEYESLLSPACHERKVNGQLNKKRPLSPSLIAPLRSIGMAARRVFYFISHGFKDFPTNAQLFQKFKSHQFSAIKTPEEYRTVKNLFTRFRLLNQFSALELDLIHQQLKKIKESFNAQIQAVQPGSQQVDWVDVVAYQPLVVVKEEKVDKQEVIKQHQALLEAQAPDELKIDIYVSLLPAPVPLKQEELVSLNDSKPLSVKDSVRILVEPNQTLTTLQALTQQLYQGIGRVTPKFLKYSEEKRFIQWKVKNYEDMLGQIKQALEGILNNRFQFTLAAMLATCQQESALPWQKNLLPILVTLNQELPQGEDRYSLLYLQKVSQIYVTFIRNLRKAIQEGGAHEENAIFDELSFSLYTHTNLNYRCQKIVRTLCSLGNRASPEPLDETHLESHEDLENPQYRLIRDLEHLNGLIKAAPTEAKTTVIQKGVKSLVDHVGGIGVYGYTLAKFDPVEQGNFTHQIMQIQIRQGEETKTIRDIAMGTPTIEIGDKNPQIGPEFLGYLRHLKRLGQKHLYINNQDARPTSRAAGDESPRCRAIKQLMDGEFKGTFFTIFLSKNTEFYTQKRRGNQTADSFQKELMAEVFEGQSETTGNDIPAELMEKYNLKAWGKEAAQKIHQIVFERREELTYQEKRTFIELFYTHLVQKIMVELKPDAYNWSCKDRIDRGAASDAGFFAYLKTLFNEERLEEVKRFFESMVFARALIVRNRTIIQERLERLSEFLAYVFDHKEKIQVLQAILFPDVNIEASPLPVINKEKQRSPEAGSLNLSVTQFHMLEARA